MEIIVEYVIINNFLIDLSVMYACCLTVKVRAVWYRLIISALTGAVFALILPITPSPYDSVIKAVSLIALCVLAVGINPPVLIKYTLVFLLYTGMLGGLIIMARYFNMPVMKALDDKASCLPGLASLLALIAAMSLKGAVRLINRRGDPETVMAVSINTGENDYLDKGLYDSGNSLYYKGIYPVVVLSDELLTGRSVGRIKVKTVTGVRAMDVYRIKSISAGGKVYRNVYAIKRKLDEEYKVILHRDIGRKR